MINEGDAQVGSTLVSSSIEPERALCLTHAMSCTDEPSPDLTLGLNVVSSLPLLIAHLARLTNKDDPKLRAVSKQTIQHTSEPWKQI